MSYFKITYESDTIEGLKAIQSNIVGDSANARDSTNSDTKVAPPPLQDTGNLDAFSGAVQAPPLSSIDSSGLDMNASPPPMIAVSGIAGIGLDGETPPPPMNTLQNQEGTGFLAPPQQSSEGSQKPPSKSSK
jgi:hypothetical protein